MVDYRWGNPCGYPGNHKGYLFWIFWLGNHKGCLFWIFWLGNHKGCPYQVRFFKYSWICSLGTGNSSI